MGDVLARPSTRLYYTYIVMLVHPISLYLYTKGESVLPVVTCCMLMNTTGAMPLRDGRHGRSAVTDCDSAVRRVTSSPTIKRHQLSFSRVFFYHRMNRIK